MSGPSKVSVLGRHIDLLLEETESATLDRLAAARGCSALFCNVHMLMASRDDPVLASAMDSADFVFADGVPVAWLQSRLSGHRAKLLRGYEAVLHLCEKAGVEGKRVGFLGSTPPVLEALNRELTERWPQLQIAYSNAPPMVEGEWHSTDSEIEDMNAADLDYLFIGLGCPKQEKWVYRHSRRLNCSSLAVGAAFDWLAGVEPAPPRWMERAALGWLHRLIHHPLSLWRRYFIYNTRFIVAAALAVGRQKLSGARSG